MNVKSHSKYPSEIEMIALRLLREAQFAGVFKDNEPVGPQLRAAAVRMLEDNMSFKEMTMGENQVPVKLSILLDRKTLQAEQEIYSSREKEKQDIREEMLDLL